MELQVRRSSKFLIYSQEMATIGCKLMGWFYRSANKVRIAFVLKASELGGC